VKNLFGQVTVAIVVCAESIDILAHGGDDQIIADLSGQDAFAEEKVIGIDLFQNG
jgi:hypothetical protein